jgi:hypothetical protein
MAPLVHVREPPEAASKFLCHALCVVLRGARGRRCVLLLLMLLLPHGAPILVCSAYSCAVCSYARPLGTQLSGSHLKLPLLFPFLSSCSPSSQFMLPFLLLPSPAHAPLSLLMLMLPFLSHLVSVLDCPFPLSFSRGPLLA